MKTSYAPNFLKLARFTLTRPLIVVDAVCALVHVSPATENSSSALTELCICHGHDRNGVGRQPRLQQRPETIILDAKKKACGHISQRVLSAEELHLIQSKSRARGRTSRPGKRGEKAEALHWRRQNSIWTSRLPSWPAAVLLGLCVLTISYIGVGHCPRLWLIAAHRQR